MRRKVYRDGSLVTLVTVTSYSDTGLSGNTAYSYTISAYDDAVPANESAQSSPPVNVTTLDTSPPTVPLNLSATPVSETQVNLSWSASTDNGGGSVAGYRVYRDAALITTVTSGTSYSDTGYSQFLMDRYRDARLEVDAGGVRSGVSYVDLTIWINSTESIKERLILKATGESGGTLLSIVARKELD